MKLTLYDTTLRDGAQQEGISLTVGEKLRIVSLLDALGIDIIEGGWPSANPKDRSFFARVGELPLTCSKISAFGSTRKASIHVEDDVQRLRRRRVQARPQRAHHGRGQRGDDADLQKVLDQFEIGALLK